jgi:hypothetical protein
MKTDLPIKTSSRSGRFRKKLVSETEMVLEAPCILAKISPLLDLYSANKLTQADFTASYLITYLSHRFPQTWLGPLIKGRKISGISWKSLPMEFEPNILKRLDQIDSIQDIFSHFSLKSTPMAVNRALVNWSQDQYGLELMFRIPRPQEVLKQQIYGRRCVTTIIDERISSYILGQRDSLSFTMHDLIHADQFYSNNLCYEGQLGLYGLLDKTFDYFDLSQEKFAEEFEYIISDMNAYAIHLLKCLKSAMIYYFDEDYFLSWLKNLDAPKPLSLLNTTAYEPLQMDEVILSWLSSFKIVRNVLC